MNEWMNEWMNESDGVSLYEYNGLPASHMVCH